MGSDERLIAELVLESDYFVRIYDLNGVIQLTAITGRDRSRQSAQSFTLSENAVSILWEELGAWLQAKKAIAALS